MISPRAVEAIESSDTDELLRVVDGLCTAADWEGLEELKLRCREAVGRGKQLWGVEEHIRYRLALEAPAGWAGPAVAEGPARFSLGPMPEVAASTKTWAELDPHIEFGPWRAVTAAERVIRGESGCGPIPDVPSELQDWERSYVTATYKSDKVEAHPPPIPAVAPVELPDDYESLEDPHSTGALADLVDAWVTESNGRVTTAAVQGSAVAAIRALGIKTARMGRLSPSSAFAWMAWAGSTGGAHGRRRGAAAGRNGAWWAIAAISDLDWPVEPEAMRRAIDDLGFYWFDDGSPPVGWALRLAIEDPANGYSWAISATDLAT